MRLRRQHKRALENLSMLRNKKCPLGQPIAVTQGQPFLATQTGVSTTIKFPNAMKVQILTRAFQLVWKTDFLCNTNQQRLRFKDVLLGEKSRYSSMNRRKKRMTPDFYLVFFKRCNIICKSQIKSLISNIIKVAKCNLTKLQNLKDFHLL